MLRRLWRRLFPAVDRLHVPPPCQHRYVVAVNTIHRDGLRATQQIRCTSCPHVFDTREVEVRREED